MKNLVYVFVIRTTVHINVCAFLLLYNASLHITLFNVLNIWFSLKSLHNVIMAIYSILCYPPGITVGCGLVHLLPRWTVMSCCTDPADSPLVVHLCFSWFSVVLKAVKMMNVYSHLISHQQVKTHIEYPQIYMQLSSVLIFSVLYHVVILKYFCK